MFFVIFNQKQDEASTASTTVTCDEEDMEKNDARTEVCRRIAWSENDRDGDMEKTITSCPESPQPITISSGYIGDTCSSPTIVYAYMKTLSCGTFGETHLICRKDDYKKQVHYNSVLHRKLHYICNCQEIGGSRATLQYCT
jgi:hypothetical protein